MKFPKSILSYNKPLQRVDIQLGVAIVLYALLLLGWTSSLAGHVTAGYWLSGVAFIVSIRLLLYVAKSTELAAICVIGLGLVILHGMTARQFGELAIYTLAFSVWTTYFRWPARNLAILLGFVTGLLAVLLGHQGVALLTLFGFALGMRIFWHTIFERLAMRAFIMFVAKALVMICVALVTYMVFSHFVKVTWADTSYIFSVEGWSRIALLVLGLLALRGVWASILLSTARSPRAGGLRIYWLVCSAIIAVTTQLLQVHGRQVFQPAALSHLASSGLTTIWPLAVVVSALSVVLLAQAGIDRSLFRDAPGIRRLFGAALRRL